MSDYATFKAMPAQERDELGFAKWRENQHIGTHGPGCWKYGQNHYDCALIEIERRGLAAASWQEQPEPSNEGFFNSGGSKCLST